MQVSALERVRAAIRTAPIVEREHEFSGGGKGEVIKLDSRMVTTHSSATHLMKSDCITKVATWSTNESGTPTRNASHTISDSPPSALSQPAAARNARIGVSIALMLALVGFLGWELHLPILQTLCPNRPPMVPSAAVMQALLGIGLWLALPKPAPGELNARFRGGQAIAAMAAALGIVVLGSDMFGWALHPAVQMLGGKQPSFPASATALSLGLAVCLLDVRFRRVWVSEVLAVITMQIALLALIGHAFGVPELYGSLYFRFDRGMALPSAIGFLLLSVGFLCARTERGLMALLQSHTPGGTLARRWVLTPAAVLLVMGLVYLILQQAAGVPRGLGAWALLMTSFTFLTVAIWTTADVLHRAGLERDHAQRRLEHRVLQRTAELEKVNEALKSAKEDLARVNADLEQTINQRTAHLEETIRALETVCYNIAHDLRAPNRAIAGFAEALLAGHAGSLDEVARECLKRIAAAAQRSDMLTVDLLAYGRLGHAELPCSKQSLEVHLKVALEQFEQEIGSRAATVEVIGPLPEVWANPTALQQVLTNLLSNALKFVAEEVSPRVSIRAEQDGGGCRVFIQDNGIGIPREYQEKIFGVFQRLHSVEKYPGTGIGLAIVHKSVERMGGKVGVSSSPGNGSCFWFELSKPPQA